MFYSIVKLIMNIKINLQDIYLLFELFFEKINPNFCHDNNDDHNNNNNNNNVSFLDLEICSSLFDEIYSC